MRKLLSLSLVLALFAGVGCDSNDDDDAMTDAEMMAGTWGVSEIRNNTTGTAQGVPQNQNLTPFIFGSEGSVKDNGFVFTFTPTAANTGRYTLMVDYKDPEADDVNIQGAPFTYTLTPSTSAEGEGTLTLQVPLGGGTVPAAAQYKFTSETAMTATIPAAVMQAIFDSQIYQGTVAVTFEKQ